MTSLTVFNANNFFLRYRFTQTYPGDQSKSSLVAASEVVGYLPAPAFGRYTERFIIWDAARRERAAAALAEPDGQLPDILCLAEVENIAAIRLFNQEHLGGHYWYSTLIDGYDPRNIDVGVLSTLPITAVRSHIDDPGPGGRLFSRDCLEVTIDIGHGDELTLFINHLKSKFVARKPGASAAEHQAAVLASHQRRLSQAQRVADIVAGRFAGHHGTALYAVVGDCNDTPESPWLAPLFDSPHLTDVLAAHRPVDDRWTYYWRSKNRVTQIDHVLASAALAQRIAAVAANKATAPHIERHGLAFDHLNASGEVLPERANLVHIEEDGVTPTPAGHTPPQKVSFRFDRYGEVLADWKNNVSDHCPVRVWF